MTTANYALRLLASLKAEAEKLAKEDGTTLNQFINVAVAEKVATLRTANFFRDRSRKTSPAQALKILERISGNEPPRPGDELPPAWRAKATAARKTTRRAR